MTDLDKKTMDSKKSPDWQKLGVIVAILSVIVAVVSQIAPDEWRGAAVGGTVLLLLIGCGFVWVKSKLLALEAQVQTLESASQAQTQGQALEQIRSEQTRHGEEIADLNKRLSNIGSAAMGSKGTDAQ